MEWKEVRELVVGTFGFQEKPKHRTNSGTTFYIIFSNWDTCTFTRTPPQHPWIWRDHHWPQYSLSQHLVCWVCQAHARWQVRTRVNISYPTARSIQTMHLLYAALSWRIQNAKYLVATEIFVYAKVVAAWLNSRNHSYFNKSLIWRPHFVTSVAAPALEHGTRENAWHREPAVHVRTQAWQKKHNLNVVTHNSKLFCVVSLLPYLHES